MKRRRVSSVPTTTSNVRKDLTEWLERHATLVLTTVKEISRLRYELCRCVMRKKIAEDIFYPCEQSCGSIEVLYMYVLESMVNF
ncbi:hypothetical protein M0R45_007558 [Rubus argutus]|uniref:Uncharacterized protein n=1 Tax=Rubus argutus TaxID=59490 RepID=A0AAW1Y157_RUBAR